MTDYADLSGNVALFFNTSTPEMDIILGAGLVWPAELPQEPNNGNYKETPPLILVQNENSEGPSSVRRRLGVRKLTLPYRFTAAQTDIFDAWLENDLAGGVIPFEFVWPPEPRISETVQARINAIPTYEHQGGGVHDVTLEIIILP